jgi:hypothetical protein
MSDTRKFVKNTNSFASAASCFSKRYIFDWVAVKPDGSLVAYSVKPVRGRRVAVLRLAAANIAKGRSNDDFAN